MSSNSGVQGGPLCAPAVPLWLYILVAIAFLGLVAFVGFFIKKRRQTRAADKQDLEIWEDSARVKDEYGQVVVEPHDANADSKSPEEWLISK
jgi:hypothetical protein